MNGSRWLAVGLALAALALIIWLGVHLRFEETKVPLPLQGDAMRNPFYAATRFSEQLGARADWERVLTLPSTDAVVLLSDWNWTLSRSRRERIEAWVRDGGRLVVDDSMVSGGEEFRKWAGVTELDHTRENEHAEDEKAGAAVSAKEDEKTKKEKEEARKERQRRLSREERSFVEQFMGGDCLDLTEDGSGRAYVVCNVDTDRSLSSSRKLAWTLRRDGRIHALRVALGRGSVTVLNARPFRYREFLQGDHAKLFVAATQLHHGDRVFFFTEEDHASIVALLWRFGAPVVLLGAALLFLALWRNTTRFGPLAAPPEKARRSLSEQIRGTGLFTLRFGGGRALHAASVRALREAAVRRLPRYDQLPAEERVDVLAKATGIHASDLGPAMNYQGARTAHELRNVIAVLETARRRLSKR